MKELKNIVLKKGGRIYLNGDVSSLCPANDIYLDNLMLDISQVIKVERPTQYKTIYEAPKQILDQKEKEYLEAVIRPFRDRVKCIEKKFYARDFAYIHMDLDNDTISLPTFEKNKMYKGMELNKEYTLDELGLFEGE